MTARLDRIGTVFLGEEIDHDETAAGGTFCSSRFSGYHDTGVGAGEYERVEGLSLGDALRWARERAGDVRVRIGDDVFSAGAVAAAGMTVLPDGLVVERRRPVGEEWRDRTPADEPIRWHVDLELMPAARTPEPDWDAVFAELAVRAGASAWTKRRVAPVGIGPCEGWFAYAMNVSGFAVLSPRGPGGRWRSQPMHHSAYRLTFALDASTAERAMRDAIERCDAPADWDLLARARPLAAPPNAG